LAADETVCWSKNQGCPKYYSKFANLTGKTRKHMISRGNWRYPVFRQTQSFRLNFSLAVLFLQIGMMISNEKWSSFSGVETVEANPLWKQHRFHPTGQPHGAMSCSVHRLI